MRVIFTLPIALRKFVKGVDMEEKTLFRAKNVRAKTVGSHFSYLGIKVIKDEENIISPTAAGKMKNEIIKRDFSIATLKPFSSC